MVDRRNPGQRAGLDHSAVLGAARDVLAERGLEGLSMRALAARLGVSPNALYSHVDSKTGLVDDLLDGALAAVAAPSPDLDRPLQGVHDLMTSSYEVLLSHADLIPLYLARQGARGPNAQRLGDLTLALLDQVGVTGQDASRALHVLIVYTIGAAAFATRSPLSAGTAASTSAEDHRAEFERGLQWILTGITAPPVIDDLAAARERPAFEPGGQGVDPH